MEATAALEGTTLVVWTQVRAPAGGRGRMLCVCGERWTEAVNYLGVSASVSVSREELAEGRGRFRDSLHQ